MSTTVKKAKKATTKKAITKKPAPKAAKVAVKPAPKSAPFLLVKGQLWKMDDRHIEIMEVGKTLTHYRLFQNQKRVPISLGGICSVQAYLKTNRAKLIRKAVAGKD